MKRITLAELEKYDGKDGRPAYIGFMGRVYDVTKSRMWKDGVHAGKHKAGTDLSQDISFAPHGAGLLGLVPVAGVLVKE